MARIKDSSVEAVKSAAEILPLVEDYVRLRKAGGTYKGLCPFHQEKTPSFTVSPARGTFKCFGCGEGGDAIAFVEKLEQVDFVGAIETLAQRFGVQIEYEEISPEADRDAQAQGAPARSCWSARRRSTSACCGTASRARSRASTSPRAVSAKRCAASSGSATRRAGRR